jgi:uncharacterized protein YjdB
MVFLHKLAKRLAQLWVAPVIGLLLMTSCKFPPARSTAPPDAVAKVDLSPPSLTLLTDRTTDFVVVTLTSSDDTVDASVSWTTSGGSITPISDVAGVKHARYKAPPQPGRYKVLARASAGGAQDSSVVDVSAVPVASVSVSPASANLTTGQTVPLTATPRDSSGNPLSGRVVTWSTNGAAVATVNSNGLVMGVAAGSATITATSEGQSGTAAVSVTLAPVASVSLSPASASVAVGQTVQLTATPRDASGNALSGRVLAWSSSNPAVATVNGSGLVTGVAVGSATITATSEGQSGSSTVSVTPAPAPVASVSVSPASASVTTGQTVQLAATPRDASGNPLTGRVVTWSTNSAAVATVNSNGLVTGQGAGTATITATSEGQSGAATVTVVPAPVASVSVTPTTLSLTVGQTGQLTATPRDASGNPLSGRVVTWTTNSAAVATVNSNGLVTAQGAGSATITATSEGQSGTAAITVAVPVASVSVTPATLSLTVGQTGQLTATPRDASGNPLTGRVVTWTTNSAAVATVNSNGLVTARGAGTATITATSEGKNGTSAITVTVAPVATVSVSPASTSVAVGGTVQLAVTLRDASGNVLSGRVVTWSSNATSVATVSVSGVVTALVVGTATITATSEGQSGTASVTVTAAPPPGTTWPNEPAGFKTTMDYAFSDAMPVPNGTVGSGWLVYNPDSWLTRVSDATAPTSSPYVTDFLFPRGYVAGASPGVFEYAHTMKDHYVGYTFKYSNPYSNQATGTKQWYPYGGTDKDYFVLFSSDSKIRLGVQAGSGWGGTYWLDANVNDPTITLGVWHKFELYQKYPTNSSSNDGIFRWWIDGVLCGNYTNVGWDSSHAYSEVRIDPTWGGQGGSVAFDSHWYVDHIHVSEP